MKHEIIYKEMELYVQILRIIKNAVIDDDVDSYKLSCALVNYVNKSLNSEMTKKYQQNAYMSLGNIHLICLSCKLASVKVLQHLLSDESSICSLPYLTKKSDLLPEEEDEDCHNAMYYAIRSNMTGIPEILIDKWLNDYFKGNLDKLDDLISKAFKDLTIRNVFISEDMKIYMKNKLVNFRFFNETSSQKKNTGNPSDVKTIKGFAILRIDFVLEKISLLTKKFWSLEPNEEFLLSSQYIAINIHTLESSMTCKSRLPWKEIEFCLIIFIRSFQSCFQKYPFYHFVLNKHRLLTHLEAFSKILIKLRDKIGRVNKCKLGKLLVDEINGIENIVDFKELNDDFTQIRDMYSLEKIKSCIDLAMSTNIIEKCDQLVIVRALQVIGEYTKNTDDSSNLSIETYELLHSSLPDNMKEVITKLRNSLSHVESLSMRYEIETSGQNLFSNIISDITQMSLAITDIIRRKKVLLIRKLLNKMRYCKDIDALKSFLKQNHIFAIPLLKELKEAQNLNLGSIEKLQKLVLELEKEVNIKLNYSMQLIRRIQDIVQRAHAENMSDSDGFLKYFKSDLPSDSEEIKQICKDFLSLTSNFQQTEVESISQGDVSMPKNTKKYQEILAHLFTINELKTTEFCFQKIEYYSDFSVPPEALSKLHKEKQIHSLEENELKQFERLIMNLKNYRDQKASHVEEMFQTVHSLIENEKNNSKHTQNEFRDFLKKLITIIEFGNEECSCKVEKLMIRVLKNSETLALPSFSETFLSEVIMTFESTASELMKDNFAKGVRMTNALIKLHTFVEFNLGKIKCIKELKQMLESHEKQKRPEFSQKGTELAPKLKDMLSHKLCLLEEIFNEYNANKLFFENSLYSQKKLKLLSVIEMLTLDSMTILGCLPNHLTHNAYFLDSHYPVINGKNLRNHLAHGNALFSIVLGDDCTDMLLNAEKMRTRDLLNPGRQIGRKIKNDPQRFKDSLEGDISAVSEQLELFLALTEGKMERVKNCLSKGADVFGQNLRLQTSLHFAAKGPCLEIVKFLLTFTLDVSAVDINLQTALHAASFNGRLAIVEYLIQELNSSINKRDINGRTPLHLASINGHADVIRCLLKHQAEMTSIDLFGNAALHYAVIQNHVDIISIFLEKNADVKTFSGASALHLASEKGHKNLVETLLEKINVNTLSDSHLVPLHYAAKGGHADVVQFLIEKGADINAKSLQGTTPLHLAAEEGHDVIVKMLLDYGADPNALHLHHWTPLSFAVNGGYLAVSKLLLERGAVVDSVKNSLCSPLNLASYFGHHELVKILFHKYDAGSMIPALHMAAYKGHLSIVKLFLNNEINYQFFESGFTSLHLAACEGHTDVVNFLISKGYDINAKINKDELENDGVQGDWRTALWDNSGDFSDISQYFSFLKTKIGQTALHLSSLREHESTVRSLLKNQADIYIDDSIGTTPLYLIIQKGMADILVKESVPVAFKDHNDYSPLHLGAEKGDIEFVKYCIENGSDINARSKMLGSTALHKAVLNGHEEIVRHLIECGANVNGACFDGTTALDIAVSKNKKNIVSILISKNAEISAAKEREYLLSAVIKGHEEIVEYFLSRNPANAASRPEFHEFPLHIAVLSGHLNIVTKLLELYKRKDINDKNKIFPDPLQIASGKGFCEITRLLITNGADLNISDRFPPLHVAISKGHSEVIDILIKSGANITLRNTDGYSPIELAIKCKNLDLMETLLEISKLDINLKGPNGQTLLHHAAVSGSLEIVKSLVDKGCTMNVKDSTDAKPIHIAAKDGHQDIVEYFLNEGIDIDDRGESGWSLMHYAAAGNQTEMCRFLLKKGQNVNIVDEHESTPHHVAAQMGNAGVLDTMLHYGAYYDFRNKRNEKPFDVATASNIHVLTTLALISSLFTAVQKNNLPKVEALLKDGLGFSEFGYANIKNAKNSSLLHYAAWKGYEGIVDLLLEYNADPNVRSENGSTPLHYAAKFSHLRIVNSLLRNGAMFDAECNSKKTPNDFATDRRIIGLLNLLKAMFSKIRNNENFISDSLIGLEDLEILKSVMRVKNSCGKTLTALAIIKEHPEAELLKSLFQPDVTIQHRRAYRLYEEGRFEESLQQYKIILEKRIDLFGDEDPAVLDIQEIMSAILIDRGKFDEAQSLTERIFKIRKKILGDCNQDTISAMKLVASVLGHKGRKSEAINMYEDALNKEREILEQDNEETLRTQIQIIQLMCEEEMESKNLTKALNLSLEILEKLNELPITDFILQLKMQVAQQLSKLGKASEALNIFKGVFEIQKEMFGLYHSQTSDTLFHIGQTLFVMKEEDDSLKAFRETLEIQQHLPLPNKEKILRSRYWIANILFSQRMYREAFEIYEEDLEERKAILGDNHPEILDACKKIQFTLSNYID
ncbi:Ankyrin-2 [Araneus ventricosus]|uniref:Ankyrin-2 n=1 Tax=Araneus ventricosus TaxID=182803 RepID=A0A4Y2IJP2_ARAVE|nr:Ankyrin-2 [Araneus ventricosus]